MGASWWASCFRGSDTAAAAKQHQPSEQAAAGSSERPPSAENVEIATTSGSGHYDSGPPSSKQLRHSDSQHSADMPSKLKINFQDLSFYELIGKGSFKAVYRGRWNNTNVAVVSMRRGGLVKEARIQQLIGNHPNIVQFYRWTTDTLANEFMVMEYVKLGSMDKVLLSHGRSLQMRQRLAMCEQICSGMYELANANVLHRDLAGRNILVSSLEPVHVKVSDFGLAWIQPDGPSALPEKPPSIPIRWSPPEVLTKCEWTEKSDVWSFGVTMWEIFSSGSEPYAHCTDEQVFKLVIDYQVLSRPTRCPKEVYGLMLRCWDKDAARRPTFSDILQVFRGWRDSYHKKAVIKFSSINYRPSSSSFPKERPQLQLPVHQPVHQPQPRRRPVRRAAASVPDMSSMIILPSGAVSSELMAMPGHESSNAMMDEVLSQNSRPLNSMLDSTHKMDLIHILSTVSLSHDGSSSTKSCQVVERISEDSLVAELPMPSSWKGTGKDMSLDYLVHLRAPPFTEIAEPAVSGDTAGTSLSSELPLMTAMLKRISLQPERSSVGGPSASSSLQARKQLRHPSMPLLLPSPASRPSQHYSRGHSNASLGTFLASEGFSESHMSFEFEVPIDPMMSPTTTLSAQLDSINFSELELGDDHDQLASPLPHMLMSDVAIFQSHELSPALGMIGSREPSFESPRPQGQEARRRRRRSSRFVGSLSPIHAAGRTSTLSPPNSRAPAAASAADRGDPAGQASQPSSQEEQPRGHGSKMRSLPILKTQQQPKGDVRPMSGRCPPSSSADRRLVLSPYVDLQYLVRAQD